MPHEDTGEAYILLAAQLNLLARNLSCAPELSYPAPVFQQDASSYMNRRRVSLPAAATAAEVTSATTPARAAATVIGVAATARAGRR